MGDKNDNYSHWLRNYGKKSLIASKIVSIEPFVISILREIAVDKSATHRLAVILTGYNLPCTHKIFGSP